MGITLLYDHAAVHKDQLVGHVPGEGHLMGDDDHGGALFCQGADDPQHFAGELRIQGGGGFVKTKNVRVHGQGAGDGHPLLLAAGELVGIMIRPVSQAHLCEQLPAGLLDGGLCLAGLLAHQLPCQCHVLQGRILGEQIEILKHQTEVEPLGADVLFIGGLAVGGVEDLAAGHGDGAAVGLFQKVQAAQQRGFSAAGSADDGQGLALFQRKADVVEHSGGAEVLFQMGNFQNCHNCALLSGNN